MQLISTGNELKMLRSASTTTNCAFELIERSEKELSQSNELFEMEKFDCFDAADVMRHRAAESRDLKCQYSTDPELYEQAEPVYYPTYTLLTDSCTRCSLTA